MYLSKFKRQLYHYIHVNIIYLAFIYTYLRKEATLPGNPMQEAAYGKNSVLKI